MGSLAISLTNARLSIREMVGAPSGLAAGAALGILLVVLLLAVHPVAAGSFLHQQWQPTTDGGYDPDRRLEQPVVIEILGRAAIPTLKLLSEKTGVALGVAPEDLNTVGERKLTIISNGLTLRAIMVQLPEALKEAHWDIDTSGGEPVYLLHRNAGAGNVKAMEERARAEERKAAYQVALEEIRRSLAMSSEELVELEETDPLLSRACRHKEARDALQAFLTMDTRDMQTFLDQGRVTVQFADASPQIQAFATTAAQQQGGPMASGAGLTPADYQKAKGDPKSWRLTYWAVSNPLDPQDRFTLVNIYGSSGDREVDLAQSLVVPSYGYLPDAFLDWQYERLLTGTGMPKDEADMFLRQAADAATQQYLKSLPSRVARLRPDPPDPLFRVPTKLDARKSDVLGFNEVQRLLAEQTGLSVISDYFTVSARERPISAESLEERPLSQLLDQICSEVDYRWIAAGRCLVFHHARWYQIALFEVPETVLTDCRQQLRQYGRLSLVYLARLAAALPDEQLRPMSWPRDCQIIGMDDAKWALLLYAALTPEQASAARSREGLPFEEMTRAQQQQVRARAAALALSPTENAIVASRFHVSERDQAGPASAVNFVASRLWLQFGSRQDMTSIRHSYHLPEAARIER